MKWIEFVKKVRAEKKVSYKEALQLAKPLWKKFKEKPAPAAVPEELKWPTSEEDPARARRWQFTSFNMQDYITFQSLDAHKNVRYMCWQGEASPTTKKQHLQGYVEFRSPLDRKTVKKLLGNNSIHLEKALAGSKANIKYCSKVESRLPQFPFFEFGTPASKTQGTRTDLLKMAESLKNGLPLHEVAKNNPVAYIRHSRGLDKLSQIYKQKFRNQYVDNMNVKVFWGDAGAGKTRSIYEEYGPENCYTPVWNGSKFWFDGYSDQKVLVINEFYGQCRVSTLQLLLDRYRLQVETKGGMVMSNWDTIIITSNCHPSQWYNSWDTIPDRVVSSIIRRIDEIHEYVRESEDGLPLLSWDSIPSFTRGGGSVLPTTSVKNKGTSVFSWSHKKTAVL